MSTGARACSWTIAWRRRRPPVNHAGQGRTSRRRGPGHASPAAPPGPGGRGRRVRPRRREARRSRRRTASLSERRLRARRLTRRRARYRARSRSPAGRRPGARRPHRPSPGGTAASRARVSAISRGSSLMRSGARPSRRLVPSFACDRTLGVVAEREARDPEIRRLLLHTAGVGQDRRRILHQAEELHVAQRLEQPDAR